MKYLKYYSMNENNNEVTHPIKQSEITDIMFEHWKDKMRKAFENDTKSMNLINLCLRWLDEVSPEDSKYEAYNKRLLEFFENELAHSKKLLCNSCGKPMEVYYTVKCFNCEAGKPEIKDNEGNLIECGRWLEKQDEDFNFDEFWDILVGLERIQGNDTYANLPDSNKGEYGELLTIWKEHFPIEGISWFVSW